MGLRDSRDAYVAEDNHGYTRSTYAGHLGRVLRWTLSDGVGQFLWFLGMMLVARVDLRRKGLLRMLVMLHDSASARHFL
jgi:hypothetical protein